MAKNRYINTSKWDDEWHRSIGIVGRGLFDYLMTNPLTDIMGIYPISLPRMAFDTGIDESEIKKLLNRFEEDKKVWFEIVGGQSYIVMKNWLKHQKLGAKTAVAVASHFNALPLTLRKKVLDPESPMTVDFDQYLFQPFTYGIDSLSYTMHSQTHLDLNPNYNLNPNPNRNSNLDLDGEL